LTIRNSILEHSNGSAASIPSLVMEDSTVRYVYNGVENYARMPWQKMEIRRCTFIASEGRIYGEMNGIVPLALPEAGHIIIEGNTIGAFKTGIYLAESAPGAILQNNVFNDTETPVKITRLGLYPGDPCSFDDITIQNNTFHRTNGGGLVFYTQFGISNKNFVIRYNKLTTDSGEWTAFGQDFCWTPVEQRTGYRIHDNDLSGGGYALDSSSSVRPLWYNNIKPAGFSYASKKDVFMWDTAWSHFKFNNLTIDSYTLNNYTSVDGVGAALDPAYLAKFPVGFTTEIESQTEKGFNLIPAEWNTWTEPVYINKDQSVKLIVGEDGKFSVFDGVPAPAPAPAPEPVAPVAPVLSTGTVGIGSVVLNWTSPEAVDSFELEINEAGAGYAAHAGGVLSGTSTSIELSGLSEGVDFRFRLRSERGGLYSAWVESGPVTTLAPVPVEPPVPVLSIESVNVGSATLGWSTSEQVDSFELEAVPVSNLSLSVITATASGDKTSLSLTNLAAGESYIFRIRAARDGLFSAWTDSPPIPVPAPAPVPPVSPVLAVDSVGIGSVDLSWTISEGVDGFELEINREAAGYLPYAGGAIDGGLTSIQLNALDGNVQYSFRLRAVRSGLVSAWSESETVTTLAPTPTTNPVVAPGMPAINVDAVGVGTVDLSWALDETVDAFELQARQPGSAYATIENGIIDGAARSFQVTGLEQGGRYSFQIRAIRNDLVSDWAKTGNVKIESGPVAPEPPAAPMLAIDAVGIGSVALIWGSEETVDNYELELNEAGAGYAALDSGLFAGSETGVIVEGLLQGGSYTFRLRAIRADLTSGWTESGAVVTLVDDSGSGVGETPVVEATHYWTFDGINGSLIEDAGLAQLPLDLSGATVTDGLAMPESAIRFSGNHTGIIVPDSPTINTDTQSELTISLWVRPDLASADLTSVLYEQGSYWRGLNLIIEKGWLLASGWNRPQNESDWAGTTLNGGELAMGQWNHIALVLSAGPQVEIGGLKLYLNGQLVAEGPASQLWKQNDDNGIGQVQQSTVYRDRQIRALDPYQGDMDEFSIWHLALSEQEIQDLILLSSN
jgi:hypothetical protein